METNLLPDPMQVCRNGHVVTELLSVYPDRAQSHCDVCGAETLAECPTCGSAFGGAIYVPGFVTLGKTRPPVHCPVCGTSLPWASTPRASLEPDPADALDRFLRRLPLSFRQFRSRHGDRPAFSVRDEKDLEDMVRSLLPLQFEHIGHECRTPRYSAGTRTDFRLDEGSTGQGTALVVKFVKASNRSADLEKEWREDIDYYQQKSTCRTLACLIYDPGNRLREPEKWELTWSRLPTTLDLRCVIAS